MGYSNLSILGEVVDYVDVIEIGTPLVISGGLNSVSKIKQMYPDKMLFVDAKITDEHYIAGKVFEAGADFTNVLGIFSDDYVKAVVLEGEKSGKGVIVDLLNVKDKLKRTEELLQLGADSVIVHCGVDEQKHGKTALQELRLIKEKTDAKVAVAGGINLQNIDDYIQAKPDVIVIGRGIVKYPNRKEAARLMKEKISFRVL